MAEKTKNNKSPGNGPQQRVIEGHIRAVGEGNEKTYELSFSSEKPCNRWYGAEILSHDPEAIDLERLLSVGTVLFSHGRDVKFGKIPIAKIDKAWVDPVDHKGKASIIFDEDDEDSQKIRSKVDKGMLNGVSTGYVVDVWEEVRAGAFSSNGRFAGPCEVAVRWSPLEISLEPTPADPDVGVGRDLDYLTQSDKEERRNMDEETRDVTQNAAPAVPAATAAAGNPAPAARAAAPDESGVQQAAMRGERQRTSEISAICRDFGVDSTEYIQNGTSIEDVRAAVLEKVRAEKVPSNTGVTRDETEKIRTAASDAICLRGGIAIAQPAVGARDMRGMSLRDLAIDCCIRAGITNAHRLTDDALLREAMSPGSIFSGIVSDSAGKSMATAYSVASTTYQIWTRPGSLKDFKAATAYRISEGGDLEKVGQNGEFKFDEVSDEGVSRALATYGKEWGFTRQAFINDDLDMLTKIPQAYARSARRGINKLVYSMVSDNPAIYDGKTLFHADHGNLGTAGALGTATASEARKLMRKQKNLRGKETLNIPAKFLLVSPEDETNAYKLINSESDPSAAHSGVANPFRNSLTPVVDAELPDSGATTPYYFAADPADCDTIEVAYLNGNDMPTIESAVLFDYLGMKFRIFIDYGVTVLDFRGLVKNAGV